MSARIELDNACRASLLANSYTRMQYIMKWRRKMTRHDWFALLGHEWSCCDNIGRYVHRLRPILRKASDDDRAAMMTVEERAALAALPDTIKVFRGCYRNNRDGLSWSLERDMAARFPSLLRYRQDGTALLLEGITDRNSVVLKLDREESEIIVTDVQFVSERAIAVAERAR